MAKKRVAVMSDGTLFMAGVAAMLSEHKALEVTSFAPADADLACRLATLDAEVVVFDGGDSALDSSHALWSFVQERPRMTVIALTSDESRIQAYIQKRVARARPADLLGLIVDGESRPRGARHGGGLTTKST